MPKNTVLNLIINHLRCVKADGLCKAGCGCSIDDLAPCEDYIGDCVPAKMIAVKDIAKYNIDPESVEDDDEDGYIFIDAERYDRYTKEQEQ